VRELTVKRPASGSISRFRVWGAGEGLLKRRVARRADGMRRESAERLASVEWRPATGCNAVRLRACCLHFSSERKRL
jgi:hypothetical protein